MGRRMTIAGRPAVYWANCGKLPMKKQKSKKRRLRCPVAMGKKGTLFCDLLLTMYPRFRAAAFFDARGLHGLVHNGSGANQPERDLFVLFMFNETYSSGLLLRDSGVKSPTQRSCFLCL